MSRVIKFRAWDGVDYMTSPFTLFDIQNGRIQFASSDVVVMQFTGLKDKNGKEAYESDLVIIDGNLCQISFGTYFTCGWDFKIVNGMGNYPMSQICKEFNNTGCKNFEVIGNIYEPLSQ